MILSSVNTLTNNNVEGTLTGSEIIKCQQGSQIYKDKDKNLVRKAVALTVEVKVVVIEPFPDEDLTNLKGKIKTKWAYVSTELPNINTTPKNNLEVILPEYLSQNLDEPLYLFIEFWNDELLFGLVECNLGTLKEKVSNCELQWLDISCPIKNIIKGKILLEIGTQIFDEISESNEIPVKNLLHKSLVPFSTESDEISKEILPVSTCQMRTTKSSYFPNSNLSDLDRVKDTVEIPNAIETLPKTSCYFSAKSFISAEESELSCNPNKNKNLDLNTLIPEKLFTLNFKDRDVIASLQNQLASLNKLSKSKDIRCKAKSGTNSSSSSKASGKHPQKVVCNVAETQNVKSKISPSTKQSVTSKTATESKNTKIKVSSAPVKKIPKKVTIQQNSSNSSDSKSLTSNTEIATPVQNQLCKSTKINSKQPIVSSHIAAVGICSSEKRDFHKRQRRMAANFTKVSTTS